MYARNSSDSFCLEDITSIDFLLYLQVSGVDPFRNMDGTNNEPRSLGCKYVTNEMLLLRREQARSNDIFKEAADREYTIKGFYHTSTYLDGWKNVLAQQLAVIDGRRKVSSGESWEWDTKRWASLLDVSTELYLNVATTSR
jgi:hypothetical protein